MIRIPYGIQGFIFYICTDILFNYSTGLKENLTKPFASILKSKQETSVIPVEEQKVRKIIYIRLKNGFHLKKGVIDSGEGNDHLVMRNT